MSGTHSKIIYGKNGAGTLKRPVGWASNKVFIGTLPPPIGATHIPPEMKKHFRTTVPQNTQMKTYGELVSGATHHAF